MSEIKKENIQYALCYIPLIAFVILFVEEKKSDKLKKHIRYGIILFLIYIFMIIILSIISFGFFILNGFLTLVYLVVSGILAYKAYIGEDAKVNVLDDIENKIKDTFK